MYYFHVFHDFCTADSRNKITIAVTSHSMSVFILHHTRAPGGRQNSKEDKFV